jgi:hypothetical protein
VTRRVGFRLRPGQWVLIGSVAVLILGTGVVVARRDGGQHGRAPVRPATAGPSRSDGPACLPTLDDFGYSVSDGGRSVDYGLIMHSDCPQAAVNTEVKVTAIGADGVPMTDQYASSSPDLPVILPGQRLGLAGMLDIASSAKVARLSVKITDSQPVPVAEFSTWARKVSVANLRHTATRRGTDSVTGSLVVEPPGARLCHPEFYLILRDRRHKIIYGAWGRGPEPAFDGRFPAAADYSRAEAYVVQGMSSTLGLGPAGPVASCRA